MDPNETSNETDTLSGPQRKALEALLEGLSGPEAAERAGVGRNTVWRWLQEPLFVSELRRAEEYQLGEITRALGAAGAGAVATLIALKDDGLTPPAVRVRAASDLLGRLLPLRELVTLEARIAAIEAALEESR